MHERQLLSVPFSVADARCGGHPRGVHHGVGCARRAGWAHVGSHRARARGRVGCRHRGDPDREGDRRAHHRHDVDRQGRGVQGARRRPRRRLHAARTSSPPRSSSPADGASMSCSTSSAATTSSATSTRSPRRARSCRSARWAAAAATFTLGKMLYKRARLIGTVLRARPLEEKAAISRRFGREVRAAVRPGAAEAGDRPATSRSTRSSTRTATWRRNANVGKILLDI